MGTDDKNIPISVYTVVNGPAAECRQVVEEIYNQSIRSDIEMIVVATSKHGLDEKQFPEFAKWSSIVLEEIRTVGVSMEKAVHAAKGEVVVYVEEHGGYNPNWAQELIKAHDLGYEIVGFVLENANPDTLTSWSHLYGQFGPVVAPANSGEQDFLGGHHVSYRKKFLIDMGNRLADMMEDEGALFLEQASQGEKMYLSGEAISTHINISKFSSYLASDFYGQKSFAGTRWQSGSWSWHRRLLFIFATPLIPIVRMQRIISHIYRTGRQKQLMPQIMFPIGIALIGGAIGEMLGYAFGSGNAAEKRVYLELKRDEHVTKKDRRSTNT